MNSNELKKVTDAIDGVRKSIDDLSRTQKSSLTDLRRSVDDMSKTTGKDTRVTPTQSNVSLKFKDSSENILNVVPVQLDWMSPALSGIARISRDLDGRVRIAILVEGEDASIVETLIDQMPVKALQLSVIEP